jgi:hypothetical protein
MDPRRTMKRSGESNKDASFKDLNSDIAAERERAYRLGERAAQQFTKLLGTVHGGLGVAIAAWLQRSFELSGHGRLSPLAAYLAVALLFVALGLVALVFTAVIDRRSAIHSEELLSHFTGRIAVYRKRTQIETLGLQDDEKSDLESTYANEDAEHASGMALEDAKIKRLNAVSQWVGLGSWSCVIAAFCAVGVGIINTLNLLAGN